MSDWMLWLGFAGLLVLFELFTGTFYLLMIAIGFAAGAAAAWMGTGSAMQLVAAAVVGVAATAILHTSRFGAARRRTDAACDPNVNLDIGQTVAVDRWDGSAARVMYRGAMWDVELAEGEAHEPGRFVIREVRGSRLIVARQ